MSPAATLTDRPTLSASLREGTRAEHGKAESTGFIEALMSGQLTVAAYADLAAQQWAIYGALEAASARVGVHPAGASLVFDELERTTAIEQDLTFLLGPEWQRAVTIRPATRAYVAALSDLGDDVALYAAHAYTRYLGDLSGGQIVKRMLERHYGLGPESLAFYTFPEIPKAKPFKDLYRERLDALPLTEAEVERTVAEACVAFRLNSAVFADLGAVHC
ncbi:heme oxygenase (biliverdin-producing) [Paraoerskovia marina]|uniref:biliverdin-producing heme oxygenase n=1 Tax=Paraoerskovia marina TaxID=545619 RepID=UPI000492610B|nr:biliverdin-producing heme oxygenase [Paraoerskovia marina]